MQQTAPAGHRPKLLAVSAGPSRRLNQQTVLSPRNRPGSQRAVPVTRAGPSKKVGFYPKHVPPIPESLPNNSKLSVDQVLKQLSCTNEKILNDVVSSITRSNGTNSSGAARRAPLARNRSRPPTTTGRKLQGDMLLESYNSVAFRHQMQKSKEQSSKALNGGRPGHLLTPLIVRVKADKPKSPRYIHHSRVSAPGPCKCKSCIAKRNGGSGTLPGRAPRDLPPAKTTSSPAISSESRPIIGSQARVKAVPLLKKMPSSPVVKTVATSAPNPPNSGGQKKPDQIVAVTDSPLGKKPFGFLQNLFKSNNTAEIEIRDKNPITTSGDKRQLNVTDKLYRSNDKRSSGTGDKNGRITSNDKPRITISADQNRISASNDKPIAATTDKKPPLLSGDKKGLMRPCNKEVSDSGKTAAADTTPVIIADGKASATGDKKPHTRHEMITPVDQSNRSGHSQSEDAKPISVVLDKLMLSTVSEEKVGADLSSATLRRHSLDLSESVTLDGHIDDAESILSYPFPRPRTGSTCCQSFQFVEVNAACVPSGGAKKCEIDPEPFGMFEAIDGVVGGGNFIDLKDDFLKNRKVIRSRLGVKPGNKQETCIQWKRGPILGRGAFGTVWCGLTMAGEMVAVKQAEVSSIDLQKARKEYEKIQLEVDLLKSLSHKNIVGYLGTSLEDRIVSIFMQFIPGGSLTSILKKFGALAEPVVACYTKQILEGVEYLHSKNVVHRDIKGSNVMLMPNAVIKLIDFGCAKRAINLTKSNEEILKSMKGTPYWMAPEVMNETGHGKKSDIWSIGCTVFEMATSHPPWSHLNRYAALFTISNGTAPTPQPPDKFSDEAKRFISDCMIREPDKRPDVTTLLKSGFILQHCQGSGGRILDSRGIPLNSTKRQ